MADTQAETDDELRIAARKVLRAARASPTRKRTRRVWWGRLALLLLAVAGATVSFVLIVQHF